MTSVIFRAEEAKSRVVTQLRFISLMVQQISDKITTKLLTEESRKLNRIYKTDDKLARLTKCWKDEVETKIYKGKLMITCLY